MKHYIEIISDYLLNNGFSFDETLGQAIQDRMNGETKELSYHVRALVYAMLSKQRPWGPIEDNYSNIRKIFFEWNVDKIKKASPDYFIEELTKIKCGNRSIKDQMNDLKYNIDVFEKIEKKFGDMDSFINKESPSSIEVLLSDSSSEYKIKGLGKVLAQEYLRNIGVDLAKADVHLKRFFGGERMGKGNHNPATKEETDRQIDAISKETGLDKWQIDQIVWQFCAVDYANICGATPKCMGCPIKEQCSRK